MTRVLRRVRGVYSAWGAVLALCEPQLLESIRHKPPNLLQDWSI